MCGIAGFIGNSDIPKRMMNVLLCYMQERGHDSWGVTDGTFVYKSVGEIVEQFDELDLVSPTYHTRQHTVGGVSQRNAHPFEVTVGDKRVVGVHNGHVSNWSQLKHRYGRKDVEVDSEHIFLHLAEGKPLTEIEGSGAVVWYEQVADGPIKHYHSKFGSGDLAIAKLHTGEIVFGSTRRSVEIAARMTGAAIDTFYKTEPNIKYVFEPDAVRSEGALQWGQVYSTSYAYGGEHYRRDNAVWYPNRSTRDNRDVCAIKECRTIIKDGDLVCTWCLHKIKQEYGFEPQYVC